MEKKKVICALLELQLDDINYLQTAFGSLGSLCAPNPWHYLSCIRRANHWGIYVLRFCWWMRYCVIQTHYQMGACVYIAGGSCLASGQCITAGNYTAFLQTHSQTALSPLTKNPWRLNASRPQQIKAGCLHQLLPYYCCSKSDQMAECLKLFSNLNQFRLGIFYPIDLSSNLPDDWFHRSFNPST